jgi:hypothetical protein
MRTAVLLALLLASCAAPGDPKPAATPTPIVQEAPKPNVLILFEPRLTPLAQWVFKELPARCKELGIPLPKAVYIDDGPPARATKSDNEDGTVTWEWRAGEYGDKQIRIYTRSPWGGFQELEYLKTVFWHELLHYYDDLKRLEYKCPEVHNDIFLERIRKLGWSK